MGISYIGYGASEQNVGLGDWMDTPQTAMTTRATAVLKSYKFNLVTVGFAENR